MGAVKGVAGISAPAVFFRVLFNSRLLPHACHCTALVLYNFFYRQYRAALALKFRTRGRIPLTAVDHPLDGRIPFSPDWIEMYLDFVGQWIRMLGFLLERFGKGAWDAVAGFLDSMGALYRFAALVYMRNLSTTSRPLYLKRPRFFLLHLLDPHLMCVPSLHVMVVILTYTRFARALGELGGGDLAGPAEECRRRALDITESILYVKQHSVNCVAAAMYAMTRFDRGNFPPAEAEAFAAGLFDGKSAATLALPRIDAETAEAARRHILDLYRRFLSREPPGEEGWEGPLLEFLKSPSPRPRPRSGKET
jgi:hypothetical protein